MANVLPDYVEPDLQVLLVGINPGMRSAEKGHHFAGPGNKFWSLLADSGLTPRKLAYDEDRTLPDYGIGITNIVSRASPSSSDLSSEDYVTGRRELRTKIETYAPRAVGFVGVTVFREFWPELHTSCAPKRIPCGRYDDTVAGATLFVLPNPSGRNAHFSYDEMLGYWRELSEWRDAHA